MSVWVPLQDADERNGGLWVVPGSQEWGLQDYHMTDTGQCRKVIDREAWANEHAVPLEVSAGSVVLFSAMLWHHSRGNQTDRVRRAFIVSYQEATVKKGAGEQWKVLRPTAGGASRSSVVEAPAGSVLGEAGPGEDGAGAYGV